MAKKNKTPKPTTTETYRKRYELPNGKVLHVVEDNGMFIMHKELEWRFGLKTDEFLKIVQDYLDVRLKSNEKTKEES